MPPASQGVIIWLLILKNTYIWEKTMKKREHKIAIRMTPEEFASLKQRAKEFDGNVSEYVRNCILAGETSVGKTPIKTVEFLNNLINRYSEKL